MPTREAGELADRADRVADSCWYTSRVMALEATSNSESMVDMLAASTAAM